MEENQRGRGLREIIIWALLLVVPLAWLVFMLPQSLTGGPAQNRRTLARLKRDVRSGRAPSPAGLTDRAQHTSVPAGQAARRRSRMRGVAQRAHQHRMRGTLTGAGCKAPPPAGGHSRPVCAEADGNRTRQPCGARLTGFEDRGGHQAPGRLRRRGYPHTARAAIGSAGRAAAG